MEREIKGLTLGSVINGLIFLYVLSLYIFTYRAGFNTYSNALAFLAVAAIWIDILLSKRKIRFNAVLLFQLLFIVICLVTALYAINEYVVISKVKTLLLIFLIMVTFANYINTPEKLRKIINYFVVAGFVASIYILATSDFSVITRYGSQLGNQNAVGMNIGLSSILCFYVILSEKKYMYSVMYLPMIPCIMLTGSRKSLIFVVINITIILFLMNKGVCQIMKFLLVCICFPVYYYLAFNIPIFTGYGTVEELFSFISGKGREASMINRINR